MVQNRAGQREALFLPATHRARQLSALLLEIVFGQQLPDSRLAIVMRVGIDLGDELQIFDDGHVAEQRKLLGHVADLRL